MNTTNIPSPTIQQNIKKRGYDHNFFNLAKRFLNQEKSLPILMYVYADPPEHIDYPIKGSDMWNNIINEKSYYLYKNEIALINECAPEIRNYTPKNPIFVDLGPGSIKSVKQKTLPVLNAFDNVKSYIPIDVSDTFLQEARNLIHQEYPLTKVTPIKADFYNYISSFSYYDDVIVYFPGSTIGNIAEEYDATTPINTIKHLKKLKNIVGHSGTLIIGHDANQDVESLMKAYDNKALHNIVLYLLHRMNWDLPIKGLNIDNFECIVKWHPEKYRISYYAKAKNKATVYLDDEKIIIPKGAELHIGNSYKYPVDVFKKIAQAAGFTPIKCFQDDEKKMAIHILKLTTTNSANTA